MVLVILPGSTGIEMALGAHHWRNTLKESKATIVNKESCIYVQACPHYLQDKKYIDMWHIDINSCGLHPKNGNTIFDSDVCKNHCSTGFFGGAGSASGWIPFQVCILSIVVAGCSLCAHGHLGVTMRHAMSCVPWWDAIYGCLAMSTHQTAPTFDTRNPQRVLHFYSNSLRVMLSCFWGILDLLSGG